jgi:hypothetical protein
MPLQSLCSYLQLLTMPTPSLILVPARFKTGKLYTPLATTSGGVVLGASGDFNVTRATTATRVNANGLIESVASGIPRLDYPLGGGCPALLVEPSAANGILNSQDTATSWGLGANLSSGYVDVIGVSGNNLTVAVSGSNIGASAGRLQRSSNNVALASGSTYTISFLMRQTGTHTIGGYYAAITGGAAGDLGAGFNVSGSFSSGSIFNTAGVTSRIRRVERFGTDVYRCSETFTMTASGTLTAMSFGPTVSTTASTNPAVGLGIAFAAPQIELGALPTSFIPTTTGSITRNADAINVTGPVSGCIGQTQGTIYVEVDMRVIPQFFVPVAIDIGTVNEYLFIAANSEGAFRVVIKKATGSQTQLIISSSNPVGVYKLALAYKNGDYALSINGATPLTSSDSTNYPVGAFSVVHLAISAYGLGICRTRAAALYTSRLTNAELQSLTTL